jgi:hypothetical protein
MKPTTLDRHDVLADARAWLAARCKDGVLVLSREEAEHLISTECGRAVALELGSRIDLTAAEPSEEELARCGDD